jgi:hypothetical protein
VTRPGFDKVGAPHAEWREDDPQGEPEQVEWHAEHDGMDAIPQGDREAHGGEWDEGEK